MFPGLVGNILADMRIARTLERLRDIASGAADTGISSEFSQEIPPAEKESESDLVDIEQLNVPEGIEASQEITPTEGNLISPE